MFCSYRCRFTNKITVGEIESKNKVPHIWVQSVLIYNIKSAYILKHFLEDFHFPQTMCIHVDMNFHCPWKLCAQELVERCAVSYPKSVFLWSIHHWPFRKLSWSSWRVLPVEDTAADFCSAWFGLFRIEKLSFLASRINACIRLSQNRDCT